MASQHHQRPYVEADTETAPCPWCGLVLRCPFGRVPPHRNQQERFCWSSGRFIDEEPIGESLAHHAARFSPLRAAHFAAPRFH